MNPGLSDYIKNNNPVAIYQARESFEFPPFAAEHGIEAGSLDKLASIAFGDPETRLLPMHTKSATLWSAAYLYGDDEWNKEEHKSRKDSVEIRLDKAAKQHGISDEVGICKDFLETLRELKKQASEAAALTPKFAFVTEEAEEAGGSVGHYPINNPVTITKSACELDAHMADGVIPSDWFVMASRELMKEAKAQGVSDRELPGTVVYAGNPRLPDFDAVHASVGLRKIAGIDDAGIAIYQEIADSAKKEFSELLNKEASDKELLDCIDRHIGDWADMDTFYKVAYTGAVARPHAVFYSGQEMSAFHKLASEVVMVGDAMIPRVMVGSLSDEFISGMFGKEASVTVAALKSAALTDGIAASAAAAKLEPSVRASVLKELIRITVA